MTSEEETVLLLGGSSFLGLQTAETLYYFFDVVCTYNNSTIPNFYPEFNWFQLNYLMPEKDFKANLIRLIEKTNAKFVVNFAGISSPLEAKRTKQLSDVINDKANALVAKTCSELKAVGIIISSDHVFNGEKGPYSEIEKTNPLKYSVYGNQKSNAEKYYQAEEKYAIVRISTTIGTSFNSHRQNIYEKVINNLAQGLEIAGATNKIRTVSHFYNVPFILNKIIEGFINEKIDHGIFHLPGELLSEYDLMKKIAITHKFSPDLITKKTIDSDGNSYPLKLGLQSSNTVKILRGKFLTVDEGLTLLSNQI